MKKIQKNMCVVMDKETHDWLKKNAYRLETTMSKIIRDLVRSEIAKDKKSPTS